MMLKVSTIPVLICFFTLYSLAQNTDDCNAKLSFFHEYVKSGNFEAAYLPWSEVRTNCPKLSIAIYSDGEKILKHKIENGPESERSKYLEDLINLWEGRIDHFPDKTSEGEYEVKVCQLKYDYREVNGLDNSELYACFDQSFQIHKEDFVHPKGLYTYFSLMVDLYDVGQKNNSEFFRKYDDITEKIELEIQKYSTKLNILLEQLEMDQSLSVKDKRNKKVYESYLENYSLIIDNINSKLGSRSNCNNLVPLYSKEFSEHRNDSIWLRRVVSRMFHKDCTSDQLYETLVKQYDEVAPSADTKLYVVSILIQNGKTTEIDTYLNEAFNLEKDPYKKADIANRIGYILKKKGEYAKARAYFRESLSLNPSNGRPHLAIADMYSDSAKNCGKNNFEKRAVFWIAAMEARKAGRVDPTLDKLSLQNALSYEAKAPTKEEIFIAEMSGKTIQVDCWINSSVQIPSIVKD